jgi:RHS repeat-associated protein
VRTNGALKFLLGDHLGSTSLVTDANGQNPIETLYKAWGEVRYVSGNMPTKYQYTGQFSDSYINLLWYGSRHYDPELGRFIQPDSIVPISTQGVQAWDRYGYANNNPVKYTDPSGHGVDCGIGDPGCRAGKMDPKKQLFEYNHWLIGQVRNKKMKDLEAFSYLVERAASLTPNCTECFVNNLGAILTGHGDGNSALNELGAELHFVNRDSLYLTGNDYQLNQTGFDSIFQDPYTDEGGNPQPHHYWFYVQVGFESGGFVGNTGSLLHETILSSSLKGMSSQDLYLGYEGVDLGVKLADGTVNISEVGDYIRRTLAPGSENAEKWRSIYEVSQ